MDSGMIGKIQKAKQYAQEKERFHFQALTVNIDGNNNKNTVTFDHGKWSCTCDFFHTRGRCTHTMAVEQLMDPMLN